MKAHFLYFTSAWMANFYLHGQGDSDLNADSELGRGETAFNYTIVRSKKYVKMTID